MEPATLGLEYGVIEYIILEEVYKDYSRLLPC